MAMTLKTANNVLLVIVIAVNLYVIAIPFLPQLLFRIDQGRGKQQALEQSLQKPVASTNSSSAAATPAVSPTSQPNHVVIPAMQLDQPVVEGTNVYKALDQGVWRWPGGSTPDKGGNTVLVGHRFTYTKPKGVFYFMDKLKENDTVGIVWNNKTYVYKVTGTTVVSPNQTSILDQTKDSTLTMYTCTPLWNPKSRLVVKANLETVY